MSTAPVRPARPGLGFALALILIAALLGGCAGADAPAGSSSTPGGHTTKTIQPGTSEPTVDKTTPPPDEDLALTLERVIDTAVAEPGIPFEAFDTASLNVADLLGDGSLSIISLNDNLHTYVLDPNTGGVLAELSTFHLGEGSWLARDINGVAVGDVTGNGSVDLAILNGAATLTILEVDRAASTKEHYVFHRVWRQPTDALHFDPEFNVTHPWYTNTTELGSDGNPFIAHLPGEPGGIVLAQSDGLPGHFAFNSTGDLRWYTDFWDGNAGPWAGVLKPKGPVQALFSTDGGHLVDYDVKTGVIQWDFDATRFVNPGSISVMPNVFDLAGDGKKSIFFGARRAVNDTVTPDMVAAGATPDGNWTDWMLRQHAEYFLLDADGHVLWNVSFPWGNPSIYMQPAAVDVNGDGVKDIIAQDWNTIGHHPGFWEKLGQANLFALDGKDGHAIWHTHVDSSWSNKGIAIASFLPGGTQILVEDQLGDSDGFSLYDMDGKHLRWIPVQAEGWRITRGPVLADVDGDGLVEAIVPVTKDANHCLRGDAVCMRTQTYHCLHTDVLCRMGAILVFKTEAPNASVLFSANTLFDSNDSGALPVAL